MEDAVVVWYGGKRKLMEIWMENFPSKPIPPK